MTHQAEVYLAVVLSIALLILILGVASLTSTLRRVVESRRARAARCDGTRG